MVERCKRCRAYATPESALACRQKHCFQSLLLTGKDRIKRKFLGDLEDWLTPVKLYHAFTGEDDPYELERFELLDHTLQQSLLEKAEREWPSRLEAIAKQRQREEIESQEIVKQVVLEFNG